MLETQGTNTPITTIENHQVTVFDITEFGAKLRKCINGGANGPLIIADEVMQLANNWHAYKDEADGLTCTQWLSGICGPGKNLSWWKKRANAVRIIGGESRRVLDHEVAVYVSKNVPADSISTVFRMLIGATRENNGNPLTKEQAVTRIVKLLGKSSKKKTCSNCRRYEALLRKYDIDPNESVN